MKQQYPGKRMGMLVVYDHSSSTFPNRNKQDTLDLEGLLQHPLKDLQCLHLQQHHLQLFQHKNTCKCQMEYQDACIR